MAQIMQAKMPVSEYETKIKHKSQMILLQQYYLIHKDRTAVFTGSFSDEEGMKRFGRDMQSMVSSFKFEK